jgi:hypothetical protein
MIILAIIIIIIIFGILDYKDYKKNIKQRQSIIENEARLNMIKLSHDQKIDL